MISFVKPQKLNGIQLVEELLAVGIVVNGKPYLDGDLVFWLDIPAKDKAKAEKVVAEHVGVESA